MCGISGILGSVKDGDQLMQCMLQKQNHRGPDAHAYWKEENVILGHNRLSIIDLNEKANQPMFSSCGRYVAIFNGEIYNYKEIKQQLNNSYNFRTQSDTEVLIAAYKQWGKDCLRQFNGMFSFAVWDKEERNLFVARDRFGVKPFYYAVWQGSLFFSSEIKTLWAAGIPKEMNMAVWAKYLAYASYGMPIETFWENIHQLPGGHFLDLKLSKEINFSLIDIKPVRWYNFVERINLTPKYEIKELKENYLALLEESIRLRFRADVPVGFNISGGLDSSTLLALVNQAFPANKTIEAFTFYTGHPDYDELPWVQKMISLTGNPLNKCLLHSKEVPALIETISYFEDEPYGGIPTLAYSGIFKKAREKGILVLLDGQGMDEAWAGYDYYQTSSGFTVQGSLSSPVRPEVLQAGFLSLAKKEIFPKPFESDLQNLQYRDLFYTKIPRALRFNDRISMMHSTELREPFLDYRLVELAFAQKEEVKIKDGQSKWLLRQIVKDQLGDQVALAPKRPLQTPQREWISTDLKELFNERINAFANTGFAKKEEVLKIWAEYLSGKAENSFYIWQWLNSMSYIK